MGNRQSWIPDKFRPDTPSSSADGSMALDLNGNGLDTPPPSSTTSVHGQSKPVATARPRAKDKHGKKKERTVHQQQIPPINTNNLPRPRTYFPPSPELTSTSGHSTIHDARLQYGSPSPDPTPRTASSRNGRENQVDVVIEQAGGSHREGTKFSRGLVDRRGVGSAVVRTGAAGQANGKKAGAATDHRKRKDREQDPPAIRPTGFGLMAMPKKVTTYETRHPTSATSSQHERQPKRPRLEVTTSKQNTNGKESSRKTHKEGGRSVPSSHPPIRLATHEADSHINTHLAKPLKSPAIVASKVIKLTVKKPVAILPSPSTGNTRAAIQLSTAVTKQTKTVVATKTTSKRTASAKDSEETEAAKRLRLKDPIKYYAKRRPDGTIISAPAKPKSKGKASRKKITVAGEGAVVRSRQPSPFPAWHRTTAVLDRYGVPPAKERKVKQIPTDNCYVLIPIYEAKTKLVQPELIPDRFDIRSSHPALQVNELLRRGIPLACRWGDCDAILACETMLDKHVHRSGHVRKALVVPPEHYEPDAWVCQWANCTGKAFAAEAELEQHVRAVHIASGLHCPYVGCDETSEKMSQLLLHVRKTHSNSQLDGQIRPLIGANDNRGPPKRHAGPIPAQSLAHKSLFIPVARAVWRYEQRKKAVIDLVSDQCFIDRLDVKMQAGNLEMNINIGSDPQKDAPSDDEDEDDIVPEVEEEWLDREPESELGADEVIPEETRTAPASNAETTTATLQVGGPPETAMRRSTRRIEMEQRAAAPAAVDRRDMGYCVMIPVTREWVALPDGPESM